MRKSLDTVTTRSARLALRSAGRGVLRWLRVTACVWVLASMWAQPVWAARDLEDSRKELEDIQRRIGQTTRTLAEKKRAERDAAADLEKVERTLASMGKRANSIESQLSALDQKIATAQQNIGQTGNDIAGLRTQVNQRLVALYKGGDESLVSTLFTPRPETERFENYLYWERIVQYDHALLGTYRERLGTQQENLRQLSGLRTEQEQLRGALQRERDGMGRAVRVKQQLLARLRQDRSYLARELNELKERAERTNALIRKLETARAKVPPAAGTGFAGQKGRLPWPVSGRIRIPFGNSRHPELGTPYQSHGIELDVAGERPVTAVWPGRVAFASWFKGYGNLLIIDHGEGYYTLYAQAARLDCQVGDRIKGGERVAVTNGQEGRFYFEIRKGGSPLDPTEWLK